MKPKDDSEFPKSQTCELDLAQLLLLPSDSIQVQRLKQELFKYLEEKLEENEYSNSPLNSLLHDGKIIDTPTSFGPEGKRSIANLAKNGQLPTFQRQDSSSDKRSIASLARNGELHNKRELSNLLEQLDEKRNLASLARSYNLPNGKRWFDLDDSDYEKRNLASIVRGYGKRNYLFDYDDAYMRSPIYNEFKRNLASIARDMGSRYSGKRNVAALLRQDSYLNNEEKPEDGLHKSEEQIVTDEAEKRNIASLKAQMKGQRQFKRDKRQAEYWQNDEYPAPVYQNNNVYDYEDLLRTLTGQYSNPDVKRFLGK